MIDLLEIVGGELPPLTLVCGHNGVGKTTMIQWFNWHSYERGERIRHMTRDGIIKKLLHHPHHNSSQNQTYILNKPETGLHPTSQLGLGDLLIDNIYSDDK